VLDARLEKSLRFLPCGEVRDAIECPKRIYCVAAGPEDISRPALTTEANAPDARAKVEHDPVLGPVERMPARGRIVWRRPERRARC
jgi:hypothetical protein